MNNANPIKSKKMVSIIKLKGRTLNIFPMVKRRSWSYGTPATQPSTEVNKAKFERVPELLLHI